MSEYRDFIRNFTFGQRLTYGLYQFCDHFFGRKTLFKDRTKFYKKLTETLKKQGEGKIMPIERRKDLSLEEFKNHYVKKGIPVIIEGAAKDWDCVKNWSLEYFKKLHGDDEIVLVDNNDPSKDYELITLADVIDNIRSGGKKYFRFYPLLTRHPEHLKDFDYEWLRKMNTKTSPNDVFQIFMGGEGTYTSMHNSNLPNIFVQAYGEKKWILYSHYYTPIIDPSPARNLYRDAPAKKQEGPFNPFEPDFSDKYELFKYIDGYSVHLKPGDILWNPPFYWHVVKNTTDSIGVGYRWLDLPYAWKISPLYLTLDLFVRNPPIWETLKLYKKGINELHLAEVKRLGEVKKLVAEQEAKKKAKASV